MGQIYKELEFKFPAGQVVLTKDYGEAQENGRELYLTLSRETGAPEGLGTWSFGEEPWSEAIWLEFGDYLAERLRKIENDQEEFDALIDELGNIDCTYYANEEEKGENEHLANLDTIKQLVSPAIETGRHGTIVATGAAVRFDLECISVREVHPDAESLAYGQSFIRGIDALIETINQGDPNGPSGEWHKKYYYTNEEDGYYFYTPEDLGDDD